MRRTRTPNPRGLSKPVVHMRSARQNVGLAQSNGSTSNGGGLIGGVSNSTLFIGGGVVVGGLLLWTLMSGKGVKQHLPTRA